MDQANTILSSTQDALVECAEIAHLLDQVKRTEQNLNQGDFAASLDMAKALLESTFKTILTDQGIDCSKTYNFGELHNQVRDSLPLSTESNAAKILGKMAGSTVHQINELRNMFGAASHGKDGRYECPLERPETELVVRFADSLAGCLLKKNKEIKDPTIRQRVYYSDHPEFNDFLDTSHDPVDIGIIDAEPTPWSEVVFKTDQEAYKEQLLSFLAEDAEDSGAKTIVPTLAPNAQEKTILEPDYYGTPNLYDPIMTLLRQYAKDQAINPAHCVQLSNKLVDILKTGRVLDWNKRDDMRADLRTKIRLTLRRAGVKKKVWSQLVTELLAI